MTSAFMQDVAGGLFQRGIATLRFQFPYMEQGLKRPDPPNLAQATVRAATTLAERLNHGLPLIAGGRSFGGRMSSQAQASSPLPGVQGLAFLGFPLHPAGRPSDERAKHLLDVKVPMLFLQGTRDALADLGLIRQLSERLAPRAIAHLLEHADHSFHAPARTGRRDDELRGELLDVLANWIVSVSR
jgi:predicted alpha/beta-hydrolase family hydrolase